MFFVLSLTACSDFGMTGVAKPPADDSGAAPAVDTAAAPADDSGTPDDTSDPLSMSGGDPDTDTAPADTQAWTPPDDTGTTTQTDPPPDDDCVETDDLVYVLARDDGGLYEFDPSTTHFTSLGVPHCGTSASPGSMAVSRAGVAYVRYSDDSVYAVDLATLGCTKTSYSPHATGFGDFGMGYATDDAETWHETLYVANSKTVAVLDTSAWSLTTLGTLPSQAELTGNADGELWAMLPLEHPAELDQVDTTTGSVVATVPLLGFPNPADIDTFAFATWNGSFYLFVREYGMGRSTDVYEVARDGTMTRIVENAGFDVVGAGVSTCAPS